MKKTRKIVIYGTGGHAKDVLWTLMDCNKIKPTYDIVGFLDDNKAKHNKKLNGIPILGDSEWFDGKKKDVACVLAIGNGMDRKKIVKKLKKYSVRYPIIIHPSVIYAECLNVDEGTIIQAGCIIPPDVKIGKHVIINLSCTLGHDCRIEDYVSLTTGIHVGGNVKIKEGTFMGSGSIVKENINIGKESIIGAGTVVINNIPNNVLCIGVPGKIRKKV